MAKSRLHQQLEARCREKVCLICMQWATACRDAGEEDTHAAESSSVWEVKTYKKKRLPLHCIKQDSNSLHINPLKNLFILLLEITKSTSINPYPNLKQKFIMQIHKGTSSSFSLLLAFLSIQTSSARTHNPPMNLYELRSLQNPSFIARDAIPLAEAEADLASSFASKLTLFPRHNNLCAIQNKPIDWEGNPPTRNCDVQGCLQGGGQCVFAVRDKTGHGYCAPVGILQDQHDSVLACADCSSRLIPGTEQPGPPQRGPEHKKDPKPPKGPGPPHFGPADFGPPPRPVPVA